jgi:glycosyltransferase involved in cell wall biosynthesis
MASYPTRTANGPLYPKGAIPLVSILIPAYNAARYIEETLRSALAQTWPRVEIIVVDDGSTDNTLAIARRVALGRVQVFTQRNQGAAAARNFAFARSTGDYVQWLDADDLLAPDKISRQLEQRPPSCTGRTLLSSAWAHFLQRPGTSRFIPSPLWHDLDPVEWMIRKMKHGAHMQPATWLVSRALCLIAGPWDMRLVVDDDGEYFCRVIAASDRVLFCADAKTYYRITGSGSVSFIGDSSPKLEAQLLSCRLHVEALLALERSERTRDACLVYLQKYMATFYGRRPDLADGLREIAEGLGGTLQRPRLSWKYDWIDRIFGWEAANKCSHHYNNVKWRLARAGDRTLALLTRVSLI